MNRWKEKVVPYIQIARVDHWFKNIFILPGIVAVVFLQPETKSWDRLVWGILGLLAACLVASSNYVLNEILDADTDRFHPSKKDRPIVAGKVRIPVAYAEWLILAGAGFVLGWLIGTGYFLSALFLWLMGLVYNVPPIRTKEVAYLDVLSESVNNPIRLLLGWYGMRGTGVPPSSFLFAYWLIGAYLMAAKRFSEYRTLGDAERAGRYRSSFRHYTEDRLAVSMLAYASGFMFFFGVILVKYHVEFVLAFPLLVVYLAYYSSLAYLPDSVAQNPEKLYRDGWLMFLTVTLAIGLWILSFVQIPSLGNWLGVEGRGW
jgi:4-hydroxybenzoate polyprenyltransferase